MWDGCHNSLASAGEGRYRNLENYTGTCNFFYPENLTGSTFSGMLHSCGNGAQCALRKNNELESSNYANDIEKFCKIGNLATQNDVFEKKNKVSSRGDIYFCGDRGVTMSSNFSSSCSSINSAFGVTPRNETVAMYGCGNNLNICNTGKGAINVHETCATNKLNYDQINYETRNIVENQRLVHTTDSNSSGLNMHSNTLNNLSVCDIKSNVEQSSILRSSLEKSFLEYRSGVSSSEYQGSTEASQNGSFDNFLSSLLVELLENNCNMNANCSNDGKSNISCEPTEIGELLLKHLLEPNFFCQLSKNVQLQLVSLIKKFACEQRSETNLNHSEPRYAKEILGANGQVIGVDLFKTKLCSRYMKKKVCNSKNCKWAHGRKELRVTQQFYKTSVCKYWKESVCYAGKACRHAHGETELRSIDSNRKT